MTKYIHFISLFILLIGHHAVAQKETEFTIELSSREIEVNAGETKDLTINLTRSRGYNKAKAKLGISSTLPKGVSVTYSPNDEVIHSSIAKIVVAEDTQPGTYTIVLNCTINYKSKGTMLKLIVPETGASPVTKSN